MKLTAEVNLLLTHLDFVILLMLKNYAVLTL